MLKFGVVLLAATSVSVLSAQQPVTVAYSPFADAAAEYRQQSGLDTKIDLDLDGVRLNRAIQAVADKAAIKIAFGEPVDKSAHTVTVNQKRMTVREALAAILSGSGMQYRMLGEQILVEPATPNSVQGGVVTGRVIHAKTKQPIVGATVVLEGTKLSVTTANDGAFRISASPGEYTISIRSVGMVRVTKKITITDEEAVSVEIVMEPSASVLDEVIVTGTVVATERKAIPNPITVITAEEIERRGITRVEQLLRGEVPGVFAMEQGSEVYGDVPGAMVSSQVHSRGSSTLAAGWGTPDASPLKTFIDGVELMDPSYLGTIDPQSIDRIEIITGPQAATMYGSGAIGGVMQIFTKRGVGSVAPTVTAALRYGFLENNQSSSRTPVHNHNVNVSGGTGNDFTYSGSLSYGYQGPWQPLLFSQRYGGSVGVTHTRGAFTASGSVNATLNRNGTFTRGSSYYQGPLVQNKIKTGEGRLDLLVAPSQRISRSSGLTLSLNADHRLSSNVQQHITLGRSQTSSDIVPEAPDHSRYSDTLYQFQNSAGNRLSGSYNVTFVGSPVGIITSSLAMGLSGTSVASSRYSGWAVSKSATNATTSPAPSVSPAWPNTSWGGFGSWRVGLFDRLFVTLQLRGERSSTYGSDHRVDWTPTNGIAYTFEHNDITVKLLGSYGRATRPPQPAQRLEQVSRNTQTDPQQYLSQLPNPDLRPEYSRGPQGGIELYYGNRLSLTVNHYNQTTTDLIERIVADTLVLPSIVNNEPVKLAQRQYANTGKVRQKGWELTGNASIGPFTLKGTYTWSDSRILERNATVPNANLTYDNFISVGLPTHVGNMQAVFAHAGTSVTLVTNVVGKKLMNLPNAPVAQLLTQSIGNCRICMYRSRYASATGLVAVHGYTKSDLIVSHRVSSAVSITANVTNLGNSFGTDNTVQFPVIGRQTQLGVSIRFPKR